MTHARWIDKFLASFEDVMTLAHRYTSILEMTTNRYKAPPRLYNCTLCHHQSTKYARNMKKYHKHISTKIHSSSPHILSIMGSKTCTSFQHSAKVASDKWFQTEKDINQQRHCIVKMLSTIYGYMSNCNVISSSTNIKFKYHMAVGNLS